MIERVETLQYFILGLELTDLFYPQINPCVDPDQEPVNSHFIAGKVSGGQ